MHKPVDLTTQPLDILERNGGVIVVRVELWPHGKAHLSREIARLRITNDQTGDALTGHYRVETDSLPPGRVEHFPRRHGVLALFLAALQSLRVTEGDESCSGHSC